MTDWIDEGSHYVHSNGRRCRIATLQRPDGLWSVAVKGSHSSFGVTRGNAIRNVCKPVEKARAQASLDEYLAHRRGLISDDAYFASIRAAHARNLAEMWSDARLHGEA